FTWRARAWPKRLAAALAATATALVPIAACGEGTPTTWTRSGTARIDPPPPTSPSVKPTMPPDNRLRRSGAASVMRLDLHRRWTRGLPIPRQQREKPRHAAGAAESGVQKAGPDQRAECDECG